MSGRSTLRFGVSRPVAGQLTPLLTPVGYGREVVLDWSSGRNSIGGGCSICTLAIDLLGGPRIRRVGTQEV
jgi:hypothetical protein